MKEDQKERWGRRVNNWQQMKTRACTEHHCKVKALLLGPRPAVQGHLLDCDNYNAPRRLLLLLLLLFLLYRYNIEERRAGKYMGDVWRASLSFIPILGQLNSSLPSLAAAKFIISLLIRIEVCGVLWWDKTQRMNFYWLNFWLVSILNAVMYLHGCIFHYKVRKFLLLHFIAMITEMNEPPFLLLLLRTMIDVLWSKEEMVIIDYQYE